MSLIINDFIKSSDNLLDLNKFDLFKLLIDLRKYKISYLDKLSDQLDKYKFGIEIEFNNSDLEELSKLFNKNELNSYLNLNSFNSDFKFDKWCISYETAVSNKIRKINLSGFNGFETCCFGGEVISPILGNDIESFKNLKQICELLKESNAEIGNRCGLHYHVGIEHFNGDINKYNNFIKLWILFENVFYRIGCGEKNYIREGCDEFFAPARHILLDSFNYHTDDLEVFLNYMPKYKRRAIKFCNLYGDRFSKNTIENRVSNSSINPVIIQNGLNVYLNTINKGVTGDFNIDKIDYLVNKMKCYSTNNVSIDINLNDAMLCFDTIFDSNIDKINALKQYVKNDTFNCFDNGKVNRKKISNITNYM